MLPDRVGNRCIHVGCGTCGCSKYHILGVPRTISLDALRTTMKRLALEWHPDKCRTAAWRAAHPDVTADQCTAEFQRLREAFEQVEPHIAAKQQSVPPHACSLPLIDAAKSGKLSRVQELLHGHEPGAALHSLDEGGMDALSWACRLGHQEIVAVLLEAKRQALSCAGDDGASFTSPIDASGPSAALSTTALAVDSVPTLWAAAAGGDASIVSMVLSHAGSAGGTASAVNEKERLLGVLCLSCLRLCLRLCLLAHVPPCPCASLPMYAHVPPCRCGRHCSEEMRGAQVPERCVLLPLFAIVCHACVLFTGALASLVSTCTQATLVCTLPQIEGMRTW